MSAGYGYLDGAFCNRLTFDVRKIDVVAHLPLRRLETALFHRLRRRAVEEIHHVFKAVERIYVYTVDVSGFRGVCGRYDELLLAFLHCGNEQRHHSVDMPQSAVESKLAYHDEVLIQSARHRLGAYQQSDRDGQIQRRSLLFRFRRREVDRYAPRRIRQSAVLDGGAHPLFGLFRGG